MDRAQSNFRAQHFKHQLRLKPDIGYQPTVNAWMRSRTLKRSQPAWELSEVLSLKPEPHLQTVRNTSAFAS